jgi:hypothetical protein
VSAFAKWHRAKLSEDGLGSDLPDEAFAGVFDQPRERDWRKISL